MSAARHPAGRVADAGDTTRHDISMGTQSKPSGDSQAGRFRVGFDIGGTFTDLVLQEESSGRVWIDKVLTTADDPVEGVLTGLDELLQQASIGLRDASQVIHGTTLGSNIVLERRGSRTGLLTTKGFRDVLLIQRQFRVSMYNLFLDKVPPLLPRYLIREVTERMAYDGKVVQPLDEDVDLKVVLLPMIVMYLLSDVGSILGGWVSSKLIQTGHSVNFARKATMLGAGCCVLPLLFAEGMSWQALELKGDETVSLKGLSGLKPMQWLEADITDIDGKTRAVPVRAAIDTFDELNYFRNGGILHYVLRSLAKDAA